jgi:serine/threonine protein kinase
MKIAGIITFSIIAASCAGHPVHRASYWRSIVPTTRWANVEKLLAAHDKAGTFLSTPVLAISPILADDNVTRKFPEGQIIARRFRIIRFLARAEERAASALNHPNICTIHDIGEDNGQAFIAMEFLDGKPLKQMIGNHPVQVNNLLSFSC